MIKKALLYIWNLAWDFFYFIKNRIHISKDYIISKIYNPPIVKSIEDTLNFIIKNKCSVSRYGDGEIKFVIGKESWFQNNTPLLKDKISWILKNEIPNHIVCIQDIFSNLSMYTEVEKKFWINHLAYYRLNWYRNLNKKRIYYNTSISRCYLCQADKSMVPYYFSLWRKIWEKKDIIIIEGEKTRLGIGNDLFNNVKSIKRILGPNTNAFNYYGNYIEECKKQDKNHLILIALGPTATILAAELAILGYQAIDIGHIDIEYEWYLRKVDHKIPIPNKFINEAGKGIGVKQTIDNPQYEKEIIWHYSQL